VSADELLELEPLDAPLALDELDELEPHAAIAIAAITEVSAPTMTPLLLLSFIPAPLLYCIARYEQTLVHGIILVAAGNRACEVT
jgi:hypothetical protein